MVQNWALINAVSHLENEEMKLREMLGISRPYRGIHLYFPSHFEIGGGCGQLAMLQSIIMGDKFMSITEIDDYLHFLMTGGAGGICDGYDELSEDERKEKATNDLEKCIERTYLSIDEFFEDCEDKCKQILFEYGEIIGLIQILLRFESHSE